MKAVLTLVYETDTEVDDKLRSMLEQTMPMEYDEQFLFEVFKVGWNRPKAYFVTFEEVK